MINQVYHCDNSVLFDSMRANKVEFDLAYCDMMFEEKTERQMSWIDSLHKLAKPYATLYIHTDQRSVCEVKRFAEQVCGWHYRAWIINSYNWGGRPRNMWAPKHDDILVFSRHESRWTFNVKDVEIPKATLINSKKTHQIPTDVWQDIGIVHTMSKEKDEGHHIKWQKPLKLLERIILASSNPGDLVLDSFIGTGTSMVAAKKLKRNYIGCDIKAEAVKVTLERLANAKT